MLSKEVLNRLYQVYLRNPSISIDTRTIQSGDIFFALSGPNFDGNQYAAKALALGATSVVVDSEDVVREEDDRYIIVSNTLEALQSLGRHHRLNSKAKVLAITGSNGKTTTKELIASVLSLKYKIIYTKGNLNNHIGVPLTLLTIKPDTEIAIVEMGANHVGEIKDLCEIARPDLGMITNIGKAHLEGFGSVEGIKKGKGELFDFLKKNEGRIFLNSDERYLTEMGGDYNRITHYDMEANFEARIPMRISSVADKLQISFYWNSEHVNETLQLYGSYNSPNILAALNIGFYFGVDPVDSAMTLSKYVPQNKRSQKVSTARNTVYLDSYNANPTSMEHALHAFQQIQGKKKLVILGDMFELGIKSGELHQEIAELANELHETVILVGHHFKETKLPSVQKFATFEEVKAYFDLNQVSESAILLKGSRGMALERLLDIF